MNISKTNSSNITSYGYKLNDTLATVLFSDTIIMVLYLLIGVPVNSLAIYIVSLTPKKSNLNFIYGLLSVVDLTACIFGSSSFIALNTNPVNFYSGSLCKFILGSNMLLANLSGFCVLNVCINRYRCIFRPLTFARHRGQSKLLSMAGMLLTTVISVPFFIFYGESKLEFNVQNLTVSGNICGVAGTSKNEAFFHVFGIVILSIFTIEFVVVFVLQIILTVSLYKSNRRQFRRTQLINSKINISTDTKDIFADKDVSVNDSDTLVCRTCFRSGKGKECETGGKVLKSVNESISETDIFYLDNVNLNEKLKKKLSRNKDRISVICVMLQPVIVVLFALSVFPRAILMIRETHEVDFWSNLSKTEFTVYTFFNREYLLNSVLNPVTLHPLLLIFCRLHCKCTNKTKYN